MRQIKFRAWDKVNKKWLETELILKDEQVDFVEFTGLLDKNGEEIYEGDIVRFGFANNLTTHEVVFDKNFMCRDMIHNRREVGMREFWSDRLEIIGNIYENPELIAK